MHTFYTCKSTPWEPPSYRTSVGVSGLWSSVNASATRVLQFPLPTPPPRLRLPRVIRESPTFVIISWVPRMHTETRVVPLKSVSTVGSAARYIYILGKKKTRGINPGLMGEVGFISLPRKRKLDFWDDDVPIHSYSIYSQAVTKIKMEQNPTRNGKKKKTRVKKKKIHEASYRRDNFTVPMLYHILISKQKKKNLKGLNEESTTLPRYWCSPHLFMNPLVCSRADPFN